MRSKPEASSLTALWTYCSTDGSRPPSRAWIERSIANTISALPRLSSGRQLVEDELVELVEVEVEVEEQSGGCPGALGSQPPATKSGQQFPSCTQMGLHEHLHSPVRLLHPIPAAGQIIGSTSSTSQKFAVAVLHDGLHGSAASIHCVLVELEVDVVVEVVVTRHDELRTNTAQSVRGLEMIGIAASYKLQTSSFTL